MNVKTERGGGVTHKTSLLGAMNQSSKKNLLSNNFCVILRRKAWLENFIYLPLLKMFSHTTYSLTPLLMSLWCHPFHKLWKIAQQSNKDLKLQNCALEVQQYAPSGTTLTAMTVVQLTIGPMTFVHPVYVLPLNAIPFPIGPPYSIHWLISNAQKFGPSFTNLYLSRFHKTVNPNVMFLKLARSVSRSHVSHPIKLEPSRWTVHHTQNLKLCGHLRNFWPTKKLSSAPKTLPLTAPQFVILDLLRLHTIITLTTISVKIWSLHMWMAGHSIRSLSSMPEWG